LKPSTVVLILIEAACIIGAGWAFGRWAALWHGLAGLVRAAIARARATLSGVRWQSPIRSPIVRRARSRTPSPHGDLTVIRATYGSADVAERVRSLVHPRLAFNADSGTLVDDIDPDPGVFKRLEIEYRVDGSTTTATFDEGTPVDLP
jgi:hypothetical protein